MEFFLGEVNDVYLASSDDGGRSFSENVRVTSQPIDRSLGTYNAQYFVEVPPELGTATRPPSSPGPTPASLTRRPAPRTSSAPK